MAKLSRKSQQRLKRMTDGIESVKALLEDIDFEELADLVRRDNISLDPLGLNSSGDSTARRGSGPGTSPVERAVLARENQKVIKDPVREAVKKIERKIIDAEKNLRQIHDTFNFLKHGEDKKKQRQTSTPCEICFVLPAIRSGMCMNDYGEWVDAGAPDRARWKMFKLQSTSSDGKVLVTDAPPPTRPNTNS